MNIKEIAGVAELMTKHDLTEFIIESEELKLIIKRGGKDIGTPVYMAAPAAAVAAQAAGAAASAADTGGVAAKKEVIGETINSPIVGTFYSAAAPGSPAFVKAGDEVNEETVVCIVEAMKVMNEIKAEKRGRIKRVLAENATPVEYGQPLFELESH